MEQYRLDNGLTVILAPLHTAAVVAVQAWVNVGSVDEAPGQAGIAHVFEHMLFKGTERRGLGAIAQEIESAGGEINAWTAFHDTVFHVVLASRYLDIGLDVLADALQNSTFDPGEIEREREVVMEEILQSHDNPMRNVAQLLLSTALVRHPYRRPVIGDAASVAGLARSHILSFYKRWYVADNTTLVVAGDFDPGAVKRRVRHYFGAMRSRGVRHKRYTEPAQTAPRAAVAAQDVREAFVTFGVPMPALNDPLVPALDVGAIILGQGESSRLWQEVHRKRDLVTGLFTHAQPLRELGMFVVSATTRPDQLGDAVQAIAAEALSASTAPISARELAKAQRALEADIIYQRETVQGMARMYGYYHANAGDAAFERQYIERVRALTADHVRAALAETLRPERVTVAAVVPSSTLGRGGEAAAARRLLGRVRTAQRVHARSRPRTRTAARPELVSEVLGNGMRVVVKRDASVPVVAMRAVWPGGVRLETDATNGISHMLARVIVRGCGGMDAEAIVSRLDEMAGSLSGLSGNNSFGLRAEWLAESWEAGLELMAQCILSPDFPDDELEREKRRILGELEARKDSPSFAVFRLFAETLYRKHPYRLDVAGSPRVIQSLTRRKLASFYTRRYPVSGLTLAVVGDVDPERVLAHVRTLFGSAPRVDVPAIDLPRERFDARPAHTREVYRHLERNQAHLMVGFPGVTLGHPDRFPLEVLATILGGQGGRLFVQLRDRESLAYQINAVSVDGVDPGYFAVYLACSPDKLPIAVAGVHAQLQAIIDQPVSAEELDRAKRYLIGTHEISQQRRAAVAASLAFHEAYGLGYEDVARYSEHVEAVTAADVQRAAAAYLDWDLAITATVKPLEASPEAERRTRGAKKRAPKRRRGKSGDRGGH